MSKASRRRPRPGATPATGRQAGPPPAPAAGTGPTVELPAGAAASSASGSSAAGASTTRPSGTGTRPTTGRPTHTRAGRRERQRITHQPTFMERYRTAIVVVAALLGVVLLSVFVFFSASQPAFACSTIWTPNPTPSPLPGATQALGYVQPDMGHLHVNVGDKVTYTYCAPASGNHINKPGTAGPIPARVYAPSDTVIPDGWIHNLEHGGLVILYRGDSPGATADGQAAFKAFEAAFPPAENCGPVIARFDQMSSPIQALVWDRVLPLDTFDQAQINAFWNQWGGKTNAEKTCPTPNNATPSASPTASQAPSGSPVTTASPAPTASPGPSASPVPSASAAPSAS